MLNNNEKCNKCFESHYIIEDSFTTCAYYPPIYKNGVNVNPDMNKQTTKYRCMNCNNTWTN